MTKTTYITKLEEINGLKIVCKKCGANWFVPIGEGLPPDQCFSCKAQVDGSRILAASQKIRELAAVSSKADFEVLIETDFKA